MNGSSFHRQDHARARTGGVEDAITTPHPRRLGWLGTTAVAMGGSNLCLSLITALFVGQESIRGQGSAAVPLLWVGLLLSYCAVPGWLELVLMSPDRVGGIAAACSRAFHRYSPILSALTAVSYWWGWVPVCGVSAIVAATLINNWCLPGIPVNAIGCGLIALFTAVNLLGVRWVAALAVPFAFISATLAFVSMVAPIAAGHVDWRQAIDFHLTVPFPGWFGQLTSLMAGLYLVGFGAPAFEAALCHVGETRDPARNVPRAVFASCIMAALFFVALPAVWLGALGSEALGRDLTEILGPTFAPLFGSTAKAAVIGFMLFNMFHGVLQPMAGAARTLSQLSDDGLAPRFLSLRLPNDTPWVATLVTAAFAVLFLLIGDPIWLIAAANFTYLIGICLPSVAVWLLRRDAPDAPRLYRAPRGTIALGLLAACGWTGSALLGYQQFGLRPVLLGLLMAYSGAGLYAWRKLEDRRRRGMPWFGNSLHIKLTCAMLLVLGLDAIAYMLAIDALPGASPAFVAGLEDIFVAVALLTISVGIVLPGMIVQTMEEQERLATELLRAKETAVHEASHDALTGLPNRTLFVSKLDKALEQRRAGATEQFAVMFIDLDRFKMVNDSLGHLAGNELIIQVAMRLLYVLCSSWHDDMDNDSNLLARLSGDEFAALLPDVCLAEDAQKIAGKIQEALLAPFRIQDQDVYSSASIGIALSSDGHVTPVDILRDADLAMYRAKSMGKARAETYDASLHALATSRLMLESDLRRGLRNEEFLVRYQPIVLLQSEQIVGFEALVRWQSPERGLVNPADFIAVAEETGLIVPLGLWVLREACGQAKTWQQWPDRSVHVAVNISPRQFAQDDLVSKVTDVLAATGIDPALVKLEITESCMIGDPERAVRVLSALKSLGLHLAIDDFGTGYSSLSYLQRLPVDILKIDRSFVSGLLHNDESRQIVRTIMALADGMRMDVVAEGIEEAAQAVEMQRLNCRFGQGYLFSKPVCAEEAETLLGGGWLRRSPPAFVAA